MSSASSDTGSGSSGKLSVAAAIGATIIGDGVNAEIVGASAATSRTSAGLAGHRQQ